MNFLYLKQPHGNGSKIVAHHVGKGVNKFSWVMHYSLKLWLNVK
ncbi:hypothetical protein APA_4881 [Pseudanabaena sp. lw0831]|nr:hypothetical protein APA_4881 [Pseudanabaena sp. lw0831]